MQEERRKKERSWKKGREPRCQVPGLLETDGKSCVFEDLNFPVHCMLCESWEDWGCSTILLPLLGRRRSGWQRMGWSNTNDYSMDMKRPLMLGKIEGRRRRGDRGWDGWMVSPTRWTWVWINHGSWWWTGRPGILQSMGSQRVGHDWATELNATTLITLVSGFHTHLNPRRRYIIIAFIGEKAEAQRS